jgi:hypothetical protein
MPTIGCAVVGMSGGHRPPTPAWGRWATPTLRDRPRLWPLCAIRSFGARTATPFCPLYQELTQGYTRFSYLAPFLVLASARQSRRGLRRDQRRFGASDQRPTFRGRPRSQPDPARSLGWKGVGTSERDGPRVFVGLSVCRNPYGALTDRQKQAAVCPCPHCPCPMAVGRTDKTGPGTGQAERWAGAEASKFAKRTVVTQRVTPPHENRAAVA